MRKMQDFLTSLSGSTQLEGSPAAGPFAGTAQKKRCPARHANNLARQWLCFFQLWRPHFAFGRGHQFHKGLDISNRIGTPIVAPADGTITLAAPDGAYGNGIEVTHGGGIVTKFAHLQRFAVKPGQWVKRGEVIGYIGMTGRTTGPHLHYECVSTVCP